MTRIATANSFARSLAQLQLRQSNLDRAQTELATGKQIISPSDDPTGANTVIRLSNELEVSSRYIDSQEAAERFNLTSETAVASMTDVIFRIEELMLESINGTMDASSLDAIAEELQQRLEQFDGLANTKNANGDYVFSGFQTSTQTYEVDEFGYRQYQGDDGQREVLIAAGFQVKVNDPASLFLENVPSETASFIPTANAANISDSAISIGVVTRPAEYENAPHSEPYTVNFIAGAGAGQIRVEVLDSGGVPVPLEPNKGDFVDITPGDDVEFYGIEFSTLDNPPPVVGDSFEFETSSETTAMWVMQQAVDVMAYNSTNYNAASDAANVSTATITGGNIVDPSQEHEFDDYTVNILAGGLYEVYDSAGSLVEGPSDYTADNEISFRGIEFEIGGTPVAGDTFHVDRPDSQLRAELIGSLLTELKSALTTVDSTRSLMGSRLNAVELEMDAQYRFQEITAAALANIEEIDVYEAVSNLEMSTTGLTASQQSFAKVQGLSLFNYI
jgi:flagellin-like hook-associated protein FlgL